MALPDVELGRISPALFENPIVPPCTQETEGIGLRFLARAFCTVRRRIDVLSSAVVATLFANCNRAHGAAVFPLLISGVRLSARPIGLISKAQHHCITVVKGLPRAASAADSGFRGCVASRSRRLEILAQWFLGPLPCEISACLRVRFAALGIRADKINHVDIARLLTP